MKSYLTTIFGAGAAICTALSQTWPKYQTLFIGLAAVFTALLGIAAKDSNVTGGTKQQ